MAFDQKKHTLEALERRFALAKSEVQQQQQKSKKRPRVEEEHQQGTSNGQTKEDAHAPRKSTTQEGSFTTPVSRKGHVLFTGTPGRAASEKSDTSKRKGKIAVEENHPAYSQICQPVHEKLLNVGDKPTGNQIVDNVLHDIFQNGDDAARYMSGSQSKKIEGWFPLDSFVQGHSASAAAHLKSVKEHAKRCKKHMSRKQHRKSGSFDLPQEFHKFDIFEPMHGLWKDYVLKLTKNIADTHSISQRLLSADLHGAILRVAECKVNSFCGVNGIMVQETAETFGIITRENKFRVVPKRGSIFILRADCWKVILYGDELVYRDKKNGKYGDKLISRKHCL